MSLSMESDRFSNYEVSSQGVMVQRKSMQKPKKEDPFTNFSLLEIPKGKEEIDKFELLEEDFGSWNSPNDSLITSVEKQSEIPLDSSKREKVPIFFYNQEEIVELLLYMDRLFEYLPEDVIRDFARSSFYEKYNHLLSRLGLYQNTGEAEDEELEMDWNLEESIKQNTDEELK